MASQSSYFPPNKSYNDSSRRSYIPRPSNSNSPARASTPNRPSDVTGSRKRSRANTADHTATSSYTNGGRWTDLGASMGSVGATSPPPLANARYTLAGGLDTPTRETAVQYEDMEISEHDFRRRWTTTTHGNEGGARSVTVGALDRERNGAARGQQVEQTGQESWGRFVFGVVGKVLDFCKAGVFQGFSAGGGGFDSQRTPSTGYDGSMETLAPIPGQFPADDEDEYYNTGEEARPAKRRQTSRDDWVMVEAPTSGSTSASKYRASPASRTAASRSSLRPTPVHRPRASIARLGSASFTSTPQTPNSHKRAASVAGQRSPAVADPQHKLSPTSAIVEEDLQRYSAKRKRELKQTDASMRRLNDQLQMMIAEGKAALDSRVEVELVDDSDGNGF